MRVLVRESLECWIVRALIDLELVALELFTVFDDSIGVVEANPNLFVVVPSLCRSCSSARCTFASSKFR